MDDTGDITLDQRYADTDVWCEWAFTLQSRSAKKVLRLVVCSLLSITVVIHPRKSQTHTPSHKLQSERGQRTDNFLPSFCALGFSSPNCSA